MPFCVFAELIMHIRTGVIYQHVNSACISPCLSNWGRKNQIPGDPSFTPIHPASILFGFFLLCFVCVFYIKKKNRYRRLVDYIGETVDLRHLTNERGCACLILSDTRQTRQSFWGKNREK